jgi:phosphate-selective porin OprO and OprP
MLRSIWKMLGRHTLCGAALLTVANLAQAQGSLPPIPQPPIMPAVVQNAPTTQPILQVAAQEPAPSLAEPQAPGLGQPTSPLVKPIANPVVPTSNSLPAPNLDEKARIERLEKQIQELTNALKNMQNSPVTTAPAATQGPIQSGLTATDVQQLITGYLAEQESRKAAEAKGRAADGYKVGTDLRMSATWQNGVMFETPNKDFWMRTGFRFQWDNVWFHQDATNKKAPAAGVGPLVDGDYFRRIRPNFSGGFWEVGEFNVEIKMENIANGMNGLDDVWVGVKDIPFIGTVRVGHFHLPHGLEADMYSSSKPMTFFEVYSGNNAFYSGERTGSGLWLTNSFLKDRMTYAAVAYRPENASNGADFSYGDYAGILRLTGLPIYENDGRCLLHLGGSATWRHARNGTATFSTDAELLDKAGGDNGYGNPVTVTTAGVPGAVTGFAAAPGNKNTWVSTGALGASSTSIFGAEALYINGPFSLQAEYDWAFINDAIVGGVNRGNIGFTGGYIQASYFLTGENRTYDKRLGRLGGEYIARANTPFWLVKGDNGGFNYGLGAWELAARFSRLDLNDNAVKGGILDQWEAGVNWHLNNNLRVQFMYLHADRYGLGGGVPGSWMNGFGIRTQLTF